MNTSKKYQYLENIVYNELISRGYDVKVGNIENKEVDFIATRYQEKVYFQVVYQLNDENMEREFGVFQKISDHYPKYVISIDRIGKGFRPCASAHKFL